MTKLGHHNNTTAPGTGEAFAGERHQSFMISFGEGCVDFHANHFDDGSYGLSDPDVHPSPHTPSREAASLDQLAAFLTDGYWQETGRTGRRWDTTSKSEISVDITTLSASEKRLVRYAFEAWEMVADLNFVEVGGGANIRFQNTDSGAYASATTSGGIIRSAMINVDGLYIQYYGDTVDTHTFSTYVHEIGHVLGLGHQGPYNGSAKYGRDEEFTNDSYLVSVMSYFSQTENTSVQGTYGEPITPMMADLVAIQNLYGTPDGRSTTAGNTVWGANTTLDNYLGLYFEDLSSGQGSASAHDGTRTALTIYDVSGVDTIDVSFSASATRIDMNAEQFSDVGGIDNVAIGRGVIIENAIGSAKADTIVGNYVANIIAGGAGNDVVHGGAGFDTIWGGQGDDTLNGDDHADTLHGGAGHDRLFGGDGFDTLYGNAGDDTLNGGASPDRLWGGSGDDILRAGTNFGITVDGLFGGDGNDRLYGEGGFDTLMGGNGDDYLDGGKQADNLHGGNGHDTLFGGDGLDRLFGGDGDDDLTGGRGSDGLFGQQGDDILQGDNDNDRLFGGTGNDIIDGGSGDDQLFGGAGFDLLLGGDGDDILSGNFNADRFIFTDGHGHDTITDYEANSSFEFIDLSGLSAINDFQQVKNAMQQVGEAYVIIETGESSSITLLDTEVFDINASDFIF